jgi:putative membrane protein
MFTCAALQANDTDQNAASQGAPGQYQSSQGAPGQYESSQGAAGQHHKGAKGDQTQHFIKEAAMGGQMEVQMGQLAEQKSQSQEVKDLGQTLVRDHTEANQKLEKIAQQKGITLSQTTDPKHQHELTKLQSQSGTEFDKAFVRSAIKDHQKDIAEFERAEKMVQDPDLKAFISECLPKLRNHLQMAQNAARTLGIETSVGAGPGAASESSSGAPAAGISGSNNNSSDTSSTSNGSNSSSESSTSSSLNKPQSSISGSANTQVDQNDNSLSASSDINTSDSSTQSDLKGDHRVLGLSTDKTDGKILGIIPIPGRSQASANTSASSSEDTSSVGGPAVSASGSASSGTEVQLSSTPSSVRQALQEQGVDSTSNIRKRTMTVYEADVNGKKIHVTEDGKVYKNEQNESSNNDSSNR